MAADAFEEYRPHQQCHAYAGNRQGTAYEVFRETERRVGDYPVYGCGRMGRPEEIAGLGKAVVVNVAGGDGAEILT